MLKTFQDFLNENNYTLSGDCKDMFSFVSEVDDVEVKEYHFKELVDNEAYIDSAAGYMKVEWCIEWQLSDHGVTGMQAVIKHVSGNFTVVTPTEKDDLTDEKQFDTKDDEWKLVAEAFVHPQLLPTTVEINYKDNTVTVIF